MRTLQVGDRPTKLAQAVAEVGRIDKTIQDDSYPDIQHWALQGTAPKSWP